MGTRDRRGRATGRLGSKRGERYALLPEEVLQSAAYAALPDYAKAVLFAVAARFNGSNNGNIGLPFSEARKLGIPYQWKLFAGLKLLRITGLIDVTRQGRLERGTKLCSLYAVTWRGIDPAPETVSYDAGISACPLPSHAWARWERPANWLDITRKVARENHGRSKNPDSTTLGVGRSTTVGATEPKTAQPRWEQERPISAPPVVDTSKNSPQGQPRAGDEGPETVTKRTSDSKLSKSVARARKLLATLPHLSDADVMKIAKCDDADVRAARWAH